LFIYATAAVAVPATNVMLIQNGSNGVVEAKGMNWCTAHINLNTFLSINASHTHCSADILYFSLMDLIGEV
jgi:hypothetical protein